MIDFIGKIKDFIHRHGLTHGVLLHVLIILLIGFLVNVVIRKTYARLHPRLEKTDRSWDSTLLEAGYKPVISAIWFYVLSMIVPITLAAIPVIIKDVYIISIRQFVLVLFVYWFAMRYIQKIETHLINRPSLIGNKSKKTNIRAISQVVRIVICVFTVLALMQSLGIHPTTLLALSGVGGLAIGYSAKDMLANFFGGLMIFWDKPFSVGDWVRSPDRNIEGTVEHIGWRLTRIRTFDKRPLYVPNGAFSTISIENPSRMTNRRIKTTIGLRYQDADKVEAILKDVKKMLSAHHDIDTNQTLIVNLVEFGPSSLNFFVYTFTKTTNWERFHDVQQDVFFKIIAIISTHGAECAFPTTTVHVPEPVLIHS